MTAPDPADLAARRQTAGSLLILSLMALVLGGLGCLARSEALEKLLDRKAEESCRQTRKILYHPGHFQLPEEGWMYEELPAADFSKGGVFFLGSSDVQCATKFWELSPDLLGLVHNFSVSACNHKGELVELRYLIEQRGMLEAGGQKTLVVLGVSFPTAFYASHAPPAVFVDLWTRDGMYSYDAEQGLRPLPVSRVSQFVNFEAMRQAEIVTRIGGCCARQITGWLHHGEEPPRVHDPALYADVRRAEMGPEWRSEITASAEAFRETADYLQSRHVQIQVVLMPRGSWDDKEPYSEEYKKQITAVCAEKGIPVSDWSKLLADDDFADSNHANIYGMEKIQPAFLDIALPFLRSTGALPAAGNQTR